MRLEIGTFPVQNLYFGAETAYREGNLSVDRDEMLSLINQDKRVAHAGLDIVHPGDEVRIVGVRDVVEPRAKAGGPGCVFPGILGPVRAVGEGVTHRLSGTAVVTSAQFESNIRVGAGSPSASFLDMWGPGGAVTPFGATENIVLSLKLKDELSEIEIENTVLAAEMKLAQRLAQTTLGLKPRQTEVFTLTPVDSSLPRVIYILGVLTDPVHFIPNVIFYGMPLGQSLSTPVHPNELFDGAILPDVRKGQAAEPRTWAWQNQPVVRELYRQHGKTLNFLGLLFHCNFANTQTGKELAAEHSAQLARLLGADGCIVTRTHTSGNKFVDTILTVQACERMGLRTVLLTPEYGGKFGEDLPLPLNVRETDAIVSSGSIDRRLELPAPRRTIGPKGYENVLVDVDRGPGRPPLPAGTPLSMEVWGWTAMAGGIDWWGGETLRCEAD